MGTGEYQDCPTIFKAMFFMQELFDPGTRKIRFPKVTPVRSEPWDLKKYEAQELPAKILPWIFYEFTMALGTWL